jgi:hypothetical protein
MKVLTIINDESMSSVQVKCKKGCKKAKVMYLGEGQYLVTVIE